jgi:hypothetical protein
MPKYYIYDNDNQIGHLIIKRLDAPQFEQSVPITGMVDNTPFILAASFGLSFAVFSLIGWQEVGAIVGTIGGFGLAGIKAWRGSIIPESDNHFKIEAEFTDLLAGTVYRDEIKNPDIDKASLVRLCKAIAENNNEWIGRFKAKYLANVKRTQHTLIRQEFLRLDYLTEGNRMRLRGRAFVREVAKL